MRQIVDINFNDVINLNHYLEVCGNLTDIQK